MSDLSGQRIALIGECMIELQDDASGNLRKRFAGDTLNTATYLARLKAIHGADVSYITALGDDAFSDDMLAAWRDEGILCTDVRRIPGKQPGLYHIRVDDRGERSFAYWRGESAAKDLLQDSTQPLLNSLAQFDLIYLSGISLAILDAPSREKLLSLLHDARDQGSRICFDNNVRPRLWESISSARYWYQQILAITDYAFLTLDDEQLLWGDAGIEDTLARYPAKNGVELVIKCGREPCVVRTAGQRFVVPADNIPADRVIDTTAAGDSFSAGYLCGLLSGVASPEIKASLGHCVAGTVIQHRGAIIDPQSVQQLIGPIQDLIDSGSPSFFNINNNTVKDTSHVSRSER